MNFIKTEKEFREIKEKFTELFFENKLLPNNLFKPSYKYFLAFEHDYIFSDSFFDNMMIFLNETKKQSLYYYTVEPKPNGYFFNNYSVYSCNKFSKDSSDEEFNNFLMSDFGDNIFYSSEEIALFSDSNDWSIVSSVDSEIGVIGFDNLNVKEVFLNVFHKNIDMFSDIEQKVQMLNKMINFNDEQKCFYDSLIKNYRTP